MVECGHPMISPEEVQRVKAVVKSSRVPVLAHARSRREDVDAVLESGAPWVGVFASFTDLSLETKFNGKSKAEVVSMFQDSIRYAKSKGLKVRATIEDAARNSLKEIVELVDSAQIAGADRVCFADSVGILLPGETYDVFSLLRSEFPNVQFEYHIHNDQGLALANTLEAMRAGVNWFSTSCNGIGERAGITDTIQFAAILAYKYNQTHFKLSDSQKLSKLVEVYSRIKVSPLAPITGANAFTHVAKLHQIAVKKNSATYNLFDPKIVGAELVAAKDKPMHEQELFVTPFVKSATELKFHRHGPGDRFVMLDSRQIDGSPFYLIARRVENISNTEPPHVDTHTHNSDSAFFFLGNNLDYTGLKVEVKVGEKTQILESPSTVFIPAGYNHTYRFISGSGTYINFVNSGDYNQSLLEI